MNVRKRLQHALTERRSVVFAAVAPVDKLGRRAITIHIQAPQNGGGFTYEEATILKEIAPPLATYLRGMDVRLDAKSVDGRTYILLAHMGTPRIREVITSVANWFSQELEKCGSTLKVVDGPISELLPWR